MHRILARLSGLALALALAHTTPAQALDLIKITLPDGTDSRYVVALPPDFDANKSYPTLIAIPGGEQTPEGALSMVGRFEDEANARGIIVIGISTDYNGVRPMFGPYADDTLIPQLMAEMLARYPVEGGAFYVTGHSAGGESAFRAAIRHPEMFRSITSTSSYVADEDLPNVGVLKDIPVNLMVGGDDFAYHPGATQSRDALLAAGVDLYFEIRGTDKHSMISLRTPEGMAFFFDLVTRTGPVN